MNLNEQNKPTHLLAHLHFFPTQKPDKKTLRIKVRNISGDETIKTVE